jgi:hypothetical protein
MKLKTCKACKDKFEPSKPLQSVCGFKCAIELSIKKRNKTIAQTKLNESKELKTLLNAIKPKSEYVKEAQTAFNSYIRERDKDLPCISCKRNHSGQYHAGHYRTTKAAPELRFNESNVHKQCSVCNNHLSGNILEYRINLIKRIGIEVVEWIEGKHEPKKYTIDDLKSIKEQYKLKLKELKT